MAAAAATLLALVADACSRRRSASAVATALVRSSPGAVDDAHLEAIFGSTMSEQASWLDDPKSYPAWTYAADHGLSICMQMSASGIPQLIKMIERLERIDIPLDEHVAPIRLPKAVEATPPLGPRPTST